MELSLASIRPGQQMTVTHLDCPAHLIQRLREFGLVPGTRVCCQYRSPQGNVSALELRSTVVALRVRDLAAIRARLEP